MAKQSFLAALFGLLLLSAAAFALTPIPHYYIITGSQGQFTAARGGATVATNYMGLVLAAIRDDAGGNDVSIQFGDGTSVLDNGQSEAVFEDWLPSGNGNPGTWGSVAISGKITSATRSTAGNVSGTVVIPWAGSQNGVFVTSVADISNTNGGPAIGTEVGGTVKIIGGTVSTTGCNSGICSHAVDFSFEDSQSGTVILGGSPAIGSIRVSAGKLSVIAAGADAFAPAGKQYAITIHRGKEGDTAVAGGASFINSFTLANSEFGLAASGSALVLAVPSSSSSAAPSSSSTGRSSSSSGTTPIANHTLPAIHSEAPAYYNIKGEPIGSAKPAKPGVYLVKQGSSVRKVVVR